MAPDSLSSQIALPGFCQVEEAVASMAAAGVEARGAIFTRREVVDFILDLVGYAADQPLHRRRLLEPSMGQGDFLLPVIDRLFIAYRRETTGQDQADCDIVADLASCIRAVELHQFSYDATRDLVRAALQTKGLTPPQADALCDHWLIQGDFLLTSLVGPFTHVIGNPPYVRQEMIPDALMAEYRRRYSTIYDRADIYIPFIERSLALLGKGGALGFICADRWMKNRYGGPLRRYVATNFHLRHFVDMVGTDAFHSEVVAYPAIFVIARAKAGPTRVAARPAIDATALQKLSKSMCAKKLPAGQGVSEFADVARSAEPWMLDASDQLDIVRRIEAEFPTLEGAGCKVGIGVATGADQVFIALFDQLDVEPDRKLPIAMTRDILEGTVKWRGFGVINPFGADGKLVALKDYPKLAAYLERHGAAIKARHVSRKNRQGWYRTIDRIYPELTAVPKLLIPDIKGEAHIVYEPGNLYPHHNLYFITADGWNLRALQAVLMSDVTRMFIGLYSTKMRGGYLRFQAQYLRRLRVPHWHSVPEALRTSLIQAAERRDVPACNAAVIELYRLTPLERKALLPPSDIAHAA
jgi:hypothetical protein